MLLSLLSLFVLSECQIADNTHNSAIIQSLINWLETVAVPEGLGVATAPQSTALSKHNKKHGIGALSARKKNKQHVSSKHRQLGNKKALATSSISGSNTTCLSRNDLLFVSSKLLGDFVQGNSTVYFDQNANGRFDNVDEVSFLVDDRFDALFAQSYDLDLFTSNRDLAILLGRSSRQINGGATLTLTDTFIVPDLLAPLRYAARERPVVEQGEVAQLALAPEQRSPNLSCTLPSVNIDTGYLLITPTLAGFPNAVGSYNTTLPDVGTKSFVFAVLTFFDENADNIYNPWESFISASALIALQNSATVTSRPFLFDPPLPATNFDVVFSTRSGDDTQIIITVQQIGVATVPLSQQMILHAANLGTLAPPCGPSTTNFVISVGKDTDSATTLILPSRVDGSFFIGNAERTASTLTGVDPAVDGAITFFRPIVDDIDGSAFAPLLRQSSQFPLVCITDELPSGGASVAALTGDSDTAFDFSFIQCSGISGGGLALTIGDQPSCIFRMTFLQQTDPDLRLLERARFISFAALLSNASAAVISATDDSVSFETVVGLNISSISVALGVASAYKVTRQLLSSGLQKINFQHNLLRNSTTTLPDEFSIDINLGFNYTTCIAGGNNLQLEMILMATTIAFPDYDFNNRLAVTEFVQDATCISFTGGGFNGTAANNGTGNGNGNGRGNGNGGNRTDEFHIQRGIDRTLTFLVIILIVFLVIICCVAFFTY